MRSGGGRVTVAVSPSLDQGVVLVSRMPEPPAGKVYQLWLITGNSPTSAAVMAAGQRDGTVLLNSVGTADTLGVTVEPVGRIQLADLGRHRRSFLGLAGHPR